MRGVSVLIVVVPALIILGILALGVVGIVRKANLKPEGLFAEVARQAGVLRQQAAEGLLSEDQCKARLRELMIPGTDGRWWMVGYKTGVWYAHNGAGWVRAEPPTSGKSGAMDTGGR
jgi:hypothetical protein